MTLNMTVKTAAFEALDTLVAKFSRKKKGIFQEIFI